MKLELADLAELGAKAATDFRAMVGQDTPADERTCELAAAQLLGRLEFAYGMAARLAHREATLEGTEAIWARVVAICDELAAELRALDAGVSVGRGPYDRILDYRNAAERRRSLHA